MQTDKRYFKTSRKTVETSISLSLDIDGGESKISTGIGFLDHMLELFAKHGSFGLMIDAKGDTGVDYHHTVEDIGIVLGKSFYAAAGDKGGIRRYGSSIIPMDEALIETVVDFGGRAYLDFGVVFKTEKVGDFDTELMKEFFRAFSDNAKINLHIIMRSGENSHHIAEGIFKSCARSLKSALEIIGTGVMSTKGVLE